MELEFTAEQEELRASVRAVLEKECPTSVVRAGEWGPLWKQMVALDWPAMTIPESAGGLGTSLIPTETSPSLTPNGSQGFGLGLQVGTAKRNSFIVHPHPTAWPIILLPPTLDARKGIPQAIASRTALDIVSYRLGITSRSMARYQCGNCSWTMAGSM